MKITKALVAACLLVGAIGCKGSSNNTPPADAPATAPAGETAPADTTTPPASDAPTGDMQ